MFRRFRHANTIKEYLGILVKDYSPSLMSERWWLEVTYLRWTGQHLDLDHPQTFNEKLQWIKLYDRNPLYTLLVDKYKVKKWVGEKIGEEFVIPTLAVYHSPDEIDEEKLPDQFVLKCNHDSGSVKICRDKKTFDFEKVKKYFEERLKYDCSSVCGEWAYKNVPRCIIAEKYLEDTKNDALMDYKWFCFNGEPKIMYISRDKGENPTTDFFDMDFNHLPIRMQDPPSPITPSKPKKFDEMRRLAGILSQGIPEVRVDFYVVNDSIYFGEMTLYHCGGMITVQPHEWNVKMGNMIQLPEKRTTKDNGKRNKFVKC